ncbi:amidohydrolase family protein [Usitatibacter palustris]|uniref:D-galactarolactone isomerase n=1 Tax=Usitatibacter palustris TaxID=2732487 RepID=A0A6M4H4S9_9PROT|nr:amidohydrolase family protein [Usitatibacter palustris]QJR14500.1 D-galactarolactone isomerase [Usitatibacter palustris]
MKPRLAAPPGACDTHIHIFDRRYKTAPTAFFQPPHRPLEDYLAMHRELGLSRVIVVQTSVYGFDNGCVLESMAAIGAAARGVVVVPVDVDEAELDHLTKLGVRGVRFFMLKGGVLPWEALEPLAAKVRPFGWHVQLQLDGRDLPQYEKRLAALPVDLVIDHVGKFLEPVPPTDPAFKCLLRLLDGGRCSVKLAAPYETSKSGPPHFEDVGVLARELVRTHPERCLWASNWPHPNRPENPSNAAMLDLLLEWADDDATRKAILVDNPARVYGF